MAESHINASFQLVLDTAEQLIREKGCRQTTLQDIIDRTGLSKGAIYHYVSGKDELFGLILKSKMEQMNDDFMNVVGSQKTASVENPLQAIVEGMVRSAGQRDVSNTIFIYLLSQMDNPKVAELLGGIYRYSLEMAARWIRIGQDNRVIPEGVDSGKMAHIFITFMYGLRVQNTIIPDQQLFKPEDIFQLMFRFLQQ